MTTLAWRWTLAGIAAGLVIGVADASILLLGSRDMFFDLQEMGITTLATIGSLMGTGALLGTGLAFVHGLFSKAIALSNLGERPKSIWITYAIFASIPLVFVFWKLTSGTQASQIPGRLSWVVSAALIFGSTVSAIIVWIPKLVEGHRLRLVALASTALATSLLLHMVDMTVLVRLYAPFHVGLSLAAWGILAGAAFLACPVPQQRSRILAARITSVLVLLWGIASYGYLGSHHNARFVVKERTAAASDLVTLAVKLRAAHSQSSRQITPSPPTATVQVTGETGDSADGPAISRTGASVLMISVDAMRFDRMELSGASSRQVAPNIDKLSLESVVFNRAYTPAPHTSYAISSLLTGKYTAKLFDIPGVPKYHETWAEIMQRFRYDTAAFFTRAIFFIDKARFAHYWETSYGFNYRKVSYELSAKERVDQVVQYLNTKKTDPRPFFAWAHFFEPHEPYDSTCTKYGDNPKDRYDCEISVVDEALGSLLEYVENNFPETIIIVLADHGEEFGDHGGAFHGTTLYDEQVRVPLLFHIPGLAPRIVNEPVSLVDVLGTVLRIVDIPVPARVRSRDLSPLMIGKAKHLSVFAQAHEQTMIVEDGHKLICDLDDSSCRLYDLQSDKLEKRSVARHKPELVAKLRATLESWEQSHAELELRPITTTQGSQAWPTAIKSALSGDTQAFKDLLPLVSANHNSTVRHKSAELIHLSGDKEILTLEALEATRDDPIANAWIVTGRVRQGFEHEMKTLSDLQTALAHNTNPWREVALARLLSGDERAVEHVTDVVIDPDSTLEQRLEGLELLQEHGTPSAAKRLLVLINDYQVTLGVARVIGAVHYKPAIETLVTRLKRERFPERRAVFVDVVSTFKGSSVKKALTTELVREEIPSNILSALVRQGLVQSRPRVLSAVDKQDQDHRVALWSGDTANLTLLAGQRVVLLYHELAGAAEVVVYCNDKKSGRLSLYQGDEQVYTDLEGCTAGEIGPLEVRVEFKNLSEIKYEVPPAPKAVALIDP